MKTTDSRVPGRTASIARSVWRTPRPARRRRCPGLEIDQVDVFRRALRALLAPGSPAVPHHGRQGLRLPQLALPGSARPRVHGLRRPVGGEDTGLHRPSGDAARPVLGGSDRRPGRGGERRGTRRRPPARSTTPSAYFRDQDLDMLATLCPAPHGRVPAVPRRGLLDARRSSWSRVRSTSSCALTPKRRTSAYDLQELVPDPGGFSDGVEQVCLSGARRRLARARSPRPWCPRPASILCRCVPPSSRARSCIPIRPSLPDAARSPVARRQLEAVAVVGHRHSDAVVAEVQRQLDRRGVGVLPDVVQRLLGDAEQRQLGVARQTARLAQYPRCSRLCRPAPRGR